MVIGKRKLLLIDDDRLVRQSMSAYLEDSGFEVIEYDDGKAALENLQDHQPDLVLSDIRLSGAEDFNILERVREIDPEMGVIIISGSGILSDAVEALRAGASDFLTKPIADMEVLVHSIDKILERQDLLIENRRYRKRLEQANQELENNLRTLEKDQRAGRIVQQRLLPVRPFIRNGYVANYKVFPSLYLSGDFLDYAYFGDRYLAFYLTDVAGHGASSAFVTIWLKYQVMRSVRENSFFTSPESFEEGCNWLLKEINASLKHGRFESHLTCFIGVIDTYENQLRYSIGGHLPLPMIVTRKGARYLEGKGKPLGIFTNPNWEVYSAEFPDHSSLVMLTDGILETIQGDSLIEKEQKLLSLVSGSRGNIDSVVSALRLNKGDYVPDDISILTISRGVH